jgi:predicted alpha/beta superfamily hydrolase
MRRRQLLVAAGASSVLTAIPGWTQAADNGNLIDLGTVNSVYIAPTKVGVWLPPGYDDSKRRYGVVYMHDGQNLFLPGRSNFNKVWAADKSALRLIAAKKTAPFIIVGIDQPGEDRWRQYFPQALRDIVSADVREVLDNAAKGPLISDQYLKFIVGELKPMIDSKYRTKSDRMHTAIVGSSMGGLISLYAITKYPKIFGHAGAVSTHLPLANPEWNESQRNNIFSAWRQYAWQEMGKPNGRRIWFDHGTETLDAYYQPYQDVLDAALVASGWRESRDFSSKVYAGTPHEENAWAARMDDIFGWLLKGWS